MKLVVDLGHIHGNVYSGSLSSLSIEPNYQYQLETGLHTGDIYELGHVIDCNKSEVNSDIKVYNREVKVLLTEHFGSEMSFSQPKQEKACSSLSLQVIKF